MITQDSYDDAVEYYNGLISETQDDIAETANGLGISPELVNWTVDSAYVNGFFKDSEP